MYATCSTPNLGNVLQKRRKTVDLSKFPNFTKLRAFVRGGWWGISSGTKRLLKYVYVHALIHFFYPIKGYLSGCTDRLQNLAFWKSHDAVAGFATGALQGWAEPGIGAQICRNSAKTIQKHDKTVYFHRIHSYLIIWIETNVAKKFFW